MKINSFLTSFPFFYQDEPPQKKPERASVKVTEKMTEEARIQARQELDRAKAEIVELKRRAQTDIDRSKQEIVESERKLRDKENEVYRLKDRLEQSEKSLLQEKKELNEKREEILKKLEKAAKLNQAEARELILKSWEERLKPDIAGRIKVAEEKIKAEVDVKTQEILIDAMRHGSTDYIAEYTLSTINLPDDSFKGRIIGKEGRNIRAFEIATGVDVDLEEEGVIKISSFDALKREIARVAMERLIKDGRVQPVRIEEIVKETASHIDKVMMEAGRDLAHRVGVYDLPQDLVQLLGRFKYRFSYGQNMIQHTLEETKIGTALAHELKADVMTVKLGCLFHDIGKVVEGKEGSHVDLGVEVLKKHGFPEKVIHCVAASHEDIPLESTEAIIVYIADGISGGRPGARHEDFELYLKRIKDIEEAATSKKGVKEAYALQAGRELRVIVNPDSVSDDEATVLAQEIREEIEKKFPVFPGQVTITIIRETRAVATSHSWYRLLQ